MRTSICTETHATMRFHADCPVCQNEYSSCIYTLNDDFLAEESISVYFHCPDDGSFLVTGTLALTFTESV